MRNRVIFIILPEIFAQSEIVDSYPEKKEEAKTQEDDEIETLLF